MEGFLVVGLEKVVVVVVGLGGGGGEVAEKEGAEVEWG